MINDGLRACLIKWQNCTGLEIEQTHTERESVGGFWLDIFGFRQETSLTGWRFNAVTVLDENVVILKVWSGQPNIRKLEEERNPLEALQESEPRSSGSSIEDIATYSFIGHIA